MSAPVPAIRQDSGSRTSPYGFNLVSEVNPVLEELQRTRSVLLAMIDLIEPDSLLARLDPRLRFQNALQAFNNLIKALSIIRPIAASGPLSRMPSPTR